MNAVDYRKAAAEARRRGKATGVYVASDGRVCMLGAMGAAMCEINPMMGFLNAVKHGDVRRVADLIGHSGDPAPDRVIFAWSDQDSTTAEDIATLLEQVAEKMEAEL